MSLELALLFQQIYSTFCFFSTGQLVPRVCFKEKDWSNELGLQEEELEI